MTLTDLTLEELKTLQTEKQTEAQKADYKSPIDQEYADMKDLLDDIQCAIYDAEDEAPIMGDFDKNGDCI